ncbi:MAG: hypothetical protein BMS9Abin13_639 [Patescibacteria group bacterium]|nr:MAG: hypothetical protein BMS9Abin13_639 [Patescibacteria group bacterium]
MNILIATGSLFTQAPDLLTSGTSDLQIAVQRGVSRVVNEVIGCTCPACMGNSSPARR